MLDKKSRTSASKWRHVGNRERQAITDLCAVDRSSYSLEYDAEERQVFSVICFPHALTIYLRRYSVKMPWHAGGASPRKGGRYVVHAFAPADRNPLFRSFCARRASAICSADDRV